jgi:hypothetical protein
MSDSVDPLESLGKINSKIREKLWASDEITESIRKVVGKFQSDELERRADGRRALRGAAIELLKQIANVGFTKNPQDIIVRPPFSDWIYCQSDASEKVQTMALLAEIADSAHWLFCELADGDIELTNQVSAAVVIPSALVQNYPKFAENKLRLSVVRAARAKGEAVPVFAAKGMEGGPLKDLIHDIKDHLDEFRSDGQVLKDFLREDVAPDLKTIYKMKKYPEDLDKLSRENAHDWAIVVSWQIAKLGYLEETTDDLDWLPNYSTRLGRATKKVDKLKGLMTRLDQCAKKDYSMRMEILKEFEEMHPQIPIEKELRDSIAAALEKAKSFRDGIRKTKLDRFRGLIGKIEKRLGTYYRL